MSVLIALTNREFKLPVDGWYHIASLGDFPHKQSGLVQVLDSAAVAGMVNRFDEDKKRGGEKFPGVLIDQDHFSLDSDKSSAAYGWIQELSNRADGLWAQIKWSDVGEAAVKGGSYRFLSPVWNREDCEDLGKGRVRPLRIRNAACTNDPNLKGLTPLSNRNADAKDTPMKNIAAKLGMKNSDQADEEGVIAEISKLVEKLKGYEAKEDEAAKLKNRCADLVSVLANGDYAGHDFHGNQYVDGAAGGSEGGKASGKAHEASKATKDLKKGSAEYTHGHFEAKKAHESAAKAHRDAGNDSAADYHNAMAGFHAKQIHVEHVENRVKELETAALTAAVESDLTEFAGVIANRDEIKDQLMANRDATLKTLKALKTGALPNRAAGKLPADDERIGATIGQQQETVVAEIRNRDKCTFEQAFNLARAEKPELFK